MLPIQQKQNFRPIIRDALLDMIFEPGGTFRMGSKPKSNLG